MEGQAALDPVEQVLAAAEHVKGPTAGEVRRSDTRPAEVRLDDLVSSQGLVQAARRAPHGVSLGHGILLPDPPPDCHR